MSEFETIKNALIQNKKMNADFIIDSKMESSVADKLKTLRALGKAIAISNLFSENVQNYVSEIYSLFRSVVEHPVSLTELSQKIKDPQDLYDNGIITK